jgi:hypothetical protein
MNEKLEEQKKGLTQREYDKIIEIILDPLELQEQFIAQFLTFEREDRNDPLWTLVNDAFYANQYAWNKWPATNSREARRSRVLAILQSDIAKNYNHYK